MAFKKATREGNKAKILITGLAGSGKSYSALLLAKGMVGGDKLRVAAICTENGRITKYADHPDIGLEFDVDYEWERYRTEEYIEKIKAAVEAGYDILIIDGITPEWEWLQVEREELARAKFSNNSWAAGSKTKPKHNRFIDEVRNSPIHIIATARIKPEWGKDDKGNPVKVGTQTFQDSQAQYEYDTVFELDTDHHAMCSKDISGAGYQDKQLDLLKPKHGAEMLKRLQGFKAAETPLDRAKRLTRELTVKEVGEDRADDLISKTFYILYPECNFDRATEDEYRAVYGDILHKKVAYQKAMNEIIPPDPDNGDGEEKK